MGRQGAPDRGRVGACRARRPRRRRVRLGRRAHAERRSAREHLAGRVPLAEPEARRLRGNIARRQLSRERLRALRHDRERLGVDGRLVHAASPRRGVESLLRPTQPESHVDRAEPSRRAAGRAVPATGDQGRLAPLRAQLLPPLPPGGAAGADDRHLDGAPRLPLRRPHAQPTEPKERASAGPAEHPRDLGRRHRDHEPQLLQRRADGLSHAEHRPDRRRGDAVHRLLRRAELHRRPLVVHHRPERLPHRPEQGRHARAWTSASRPRT